MVGASHLRPELQFARCMSNRYRTEEFPRCVSCTRRWAGDTCRFQGIRFFLKDDKKNIVGISFVESHKPDGPSMHFPGQWNIPLKDIYIRRVKVFDASMLSVDCSRLMCDFAHFSALWRRLCCQYYNSSTSTCRNPRLSDAPEKVKYEPRAVRLFIKASRVA